MACCRPAGIDDPGYNRTLGDSYLASIEAMSYASVVQDPTMKRELSCILLFAIVVCSTAFAADQQSDTHGLSANSFKNTAWHVDCRKCNKETTGRDFTPYYMFLNADGFVGYNYETPSDYDFKSAPATWRISSGKLIVEWKHGDVERYVLTSSRSKTFSGVNQHGLEHVIERVE